MYLKSLFRAVFAAENILPAVWYRVMANPAQTWINIDYAVALKILDPSRSKVILVTSMPSSFELLP